MSAFNYLDPEERGENISYWCSETQNNKSDYSKDELFTKKGRARSLINNWFIRQPAFIEI